MSKTIDDYIKDGYKLNAILDYLSPKTGKKSRRILIYSNGSLILFYDPAARQIIYNERPHKSLTEVDEP